MRSAVMIFVLYVEYVFSDSSGNVETDTENMINDRSENVFAETIEKITSGKFVNANRVPKFLTFNNDASNIRVEAVFAIPILAIPIGGKSASSTGPGSTLPQVDINLKSIISMAGIFFLLFFVIPKLVQIYLPHKLSPPTTPTTDYQHLNTISERIDEALSTFNVDVDSCAQKALCWSMNKAETIENRAELNGVEKLMDALGSIPYLKYVVEDTWLGTAMRIVSDLKNREQATCQRFSKKCSITQRGLSNAAIRLAKYLYLSRPKG